MHLGNNRLRRPACAEVSLRAATHLFKSLESVIWDCEKSLRLRRRDVDEWAWKGWRDGRMERDDAPSNPSSCCVMKFHRSQNVKMTFLSLFILTLKVNGADFTTFAM